MSTAIAPSFLDSIESLVRSRRPVWAPSELRELVCDIHVGHCDELLAQVRFASPQRWWARLALTEEVEVWLLSWLPGQHTAPHDHGGASGAFSMLLGTMSETYRYPGGGIRQRVHTLDSSIGFGAGRAHQMWNTSQDRAATVHAYSPPLVPTREYESLWDIPASIPPLPPRRSLEDLRKEPVEP